MVPVQSVDLTGLSGKMDFDDKIIESARQIISELSRLSDRIGQLDDMFESDLIDHRIELGAYQYVHRAIRRIEEYVYEVKELE
jgi:hypothetical protein